MAARSRSGPDLEVRASQNGGKSHRSGVVRAASPANPRANTSIPSLRAAMESVTITGPSSPSRVVSSIVERPAVAVAAARPVQNPERPRENVRVHPPALPVTRARVPMAAFKTLQLAPRPQQVRARNMFVARPRKGQRQQLLWVCAAIALVSFVFWRQVLIASGAGERVSRADVAPTTPTTVTAPQPLAAEVVPVGAADDLDLGKDTGSNSDGDEADKPATASKSQHGDRKKTRREAARARREARAQARHASMSAKREAARARHDEAKSRRKAAAEARREAARTRHEEALARREAAMETRREAAEARREAAAERREAAAEARRERASGRGSEAPVASFGASKPSAITTTSTTSGTLRVNSRPWAQVFVDGRLVGNTPQLALIVTPGEHSVRLNNPTFAMTKTMQVDVGAGKLVTLIEQLDQ